MNAPGRVRPHLLLGTLVVAMQPWQGLARQDGGRDFDFEGELWKQELEQKLLPMLEKYDVVVVEAEGGLGSWQ